MQNVKKLKFGGDWVGLGPQICLLRQSDKVFEAK